MKKLSVLILTMLIAFAGHSQKTDTVCIPIQDLRKKLIQLEECKVNQAELVQRRVEILQLKQIAMTKDTVINGLNQSVIVEKQKVSNLDDQVFNLNGQIELRDQGIKILEKQLRKQKAKTFL